MSDKQELLVLLMVLPALLQLVLPLVMLILWLLYSLPKLVPSQRNSTQSVKPIERRKYPRIAGELIGARITDDNGHVIGRVKDISTSGICVTDLPKDVGKIHGEVTLLTAENNGFKLLIQPRWVRMQQSGKIFGAAILNHPVGWPILARPA